MKGSVSELRNTADAATLLAVDIAHCGMAYMAASSSGNTLSVVKKSCALGYFSFGHEVAHNFGASHNSEAASNKHYRDGHAHLIQPGAASTGYRTILSYEAEGYKLRVNYYSNPAVIFPITGTPTGVEGVSNNAAVLMRNIDTFSALGDESGTCDTGGRGAVSGDTASPTTSTIATSRTTASSTTTTATTTTTTAATTTTTTTISSSSALSPSGLPLHFYSQLLQLLQSPAKLKLMQPPQSTTMTTTSTTTSHRRSYPPHPQIQPLQQLMQLLQMNLASAGTITTSPSSGYCDPAADDWSCCTEEAPCGLGQGDCDHDGECEGGLGCGHNNCGAGHSSMDCCGYPS